MIPGSAALPLGLPPSMSNDIKYAKEPLFSMSLFIPVGLKNFLSVSFNGRKVRLCDLGGIIEASLRFFRCGIFSTPIYIKKHWNNYSIIVNFMGDEDCLDKHSSCITSQYLGSS